jgi:negative regulator of replication initiation
MFYTIPDTLLKVSLNTNKTGHHVIPDTLLKVSLNTNKTETFKNVSGIMYNMVTSFIGV